VIVRAAVADAVKQLDHVHQDSIDAFTEGARELIAERDAEVALAASLAALTGHTRRLRGRSLLSAWEGCTARGARGRGAGPVSAGRGGSSSTGSWGGHGRSAGRGRSWVRGGGM
jgi:hypothetical protein